MSFPRRTFWTLLAVAVAAFMLGFLTHQGRVRIVDRGVWNKVDVLVMNLFDNSALDSFGMPDRPEG